jgi:foldase protein PrsA
MRRPLSLILTLLAVLGLPLVLAACGGVPGNAVAEVDGESIEKRDFDAWMAVAARGGGQAEAAVPDPPDFAECIAQKREDLPEPPEGQEAPDDEALRQQCRQEYDAIRDSVMQLLINAQWIEGEAEQQGVEVTDEEVRRSFERQKDQQFQREAQYREFLEESGQTEEQLLQQVRIAELARKITEKVTEGEDEVTDAEVTSFYEENRERFAQPETRDAHVVLARTRERAEQAREALEDGDSWRSVARRFSIDQATREAGGALEGVTRGNQDAGLERALFSAEEGEIVGPVRTSLGWYVLEVDDITEAEQQTLAETRDTIRQSLVQQKQQQALQAFEEEYVEEWREKTECRDGFEVPQLCGNVEEPEETPAPTVPGAPPAGGATPAPTPSEE